MVDVQLRAVPLFRNLPGAILESVAARLRLERHEEGAVVFRRGDPADALYIVRSGEVDVLAEGTDEPLASLGPGGFVGEIGLVLDEPRSATLRAAVDTELLVLDRADLDALLTEHPSVAFDLTRELSRRLVATSRRVAPPPVTRCAAVWGDGVADLARALVNAGAGRVGALALPGARLPGAIPGEVSVVTPVDFDPGTVAGFARRRVEGLDHLLLVLPPAPSPEARVALELAEHVVVFGPTPAWLGEPGADVRPVPCDGSGPSVARAARWLVGRAVGLALSSGGSKAVAHLGVLRVLRERGIQIDAVAGTSGGALVAAALALGLSDEEMVGLVRELARRTTLRRFDVNLLPRSGLFKGVRLREFFDTLAGGRTFEEASIPLWVVAADVHTGEEVVIDRGPVADGLRASMGIPVAFNPWPHQGRLLIDGSMVNPLPASVLRDAGIRVVIGSSVAGQEAADVAASGGGAPHVLQIVLNVIASAEREMVKAQTPLVDVLVRPRVMASNTFDFTRVEEFIAEGQRAAREALPALDRIRALTK